MDRNSIVVLKRDVVRGPLSPPARGAWIATETIVTLTCCWSHGSRLPRGGRGSQLDMTPRPACVRMSTVASREGGVDRNM